MAVSHAITASSAGAAPRPEFPGAGGAWRAHGAGRESSAARSSIRSPLRKCTEWLATVAILSRSGRSSSLVLSGTAPHLVMIDGRCAKGGSEPCGHPCPVAACHSLGVESQLRSSLGLLQGESLLHIPVASGASCRNSPNMRCRRATLDRTTAAWKHHHNGPGSALTKAHHSSARLSRLPQPIQSI